MMPIIDVRSFNAKEGKRDEAVELLKSIANYHSNHGAQSRVVFPINGNDTSKLLIETEYESLGAMEEHIGALLESSEYKDGFIGEIRKNFDPHPIRHQYRIIHTGE